MNLLEKEMLHLLRHGRETYGFTHIRAEFEAEGSRIDEVLRLIEIGYKAGLDLIIKIGGCESFTDLSRARQLGASAIIAPMIESTYALEKYAQACQKTFPKGQGHDTHFYFNIETLQAYIVRRDLISTSHHLGLNGVVFGRVDFSASMNLPRHTIETSVITEKVREVASICKDYNQNFIVGGSISSDSIPMLKELTRIHLSHFETRKIAFSNINISHTSLLNGLTDAARFELLWLKNKQNYYMTLSHEDINRIHLLEERIL